MLKNLDALIEIPMLREEVKQLKGYIVRLERENADLRDRLSHRRPSTAAMTQARHLRRRWAKWLPVLSPTR